jgi:hypothetical protein
MAGSVNKVILVGNLGADPESRSLPSGGEVVNLRVATSESWSDRQSASNICARARRSISKASCRPANGRITAARTAIRPRSCCNASAAKWCCSTGATAAAALAMSMKAQVPAQAAAAASTSPVRRPPSTAIWTTTSRSDPVIPRSDRRHAMARRGATKLGDQPRLRHFAAAIWLECTPRPSLILPRRMLPISSCLWPGCPCLTSLTSVTCLIRPSCSA